MNKQQIGIKLLVTFVKLKQIIKTIKKNFINKMENIQIKTLYKINSISMILNYHQK